MLKIKGILLLPVKLIKNFLIKHNITLNYYFLSIVLAFLFTFLLIRIVGDNVLKHEAYVFKKEFIRDNEKYTRRTADKIGNYFEELDIIAIVDLIEDLGKEENVVYAYVLNSEGEVIAHTVKSEMFKKYEDKFVNKKYLKFFVNNITKVWHEEREFKGGNIVKFSRPIILQFAKEDIIEELSISAKSEANQSQETTSTNKKTVSTNSNTASGPGPKGVTNKKKAAKKEDDISRKFYIAGAVHAAYSTEKLQMISQFSKKKVSIYCYIAYLLSIVLGYFIGKHFETSITRIDSSLNAILKDKEAEPFQIEKRVDTFKKLQSISNQLINKFKDYTRSVEDKTEEAGKINDLLLDQFINNIKESVIIVNELLKVEYVNEKALNFLGKEKESVINENLAEAFSNNLDIFDKINNNISGELKEVSEVKISKRTICLVPVNVNNSLKKLVIIISANDSSEPDEGKSAKEHKPEKKQDSKGEEAKSADGEEKEEEGKKAGKDDKEDNKSIRSRLRRI